MSRVVDGRSVGLLGPHMRATAEGSMGAAGMAIESAQLAGTEGQLTASGTIGDDLDLAYRLELSRLAALSPLVGRDLAGSATVAGKLTGRPASPTIDGAFSGRALRVASLAIETAEGPSARAISVPTRKAILRSISVAGGQRAALLDGLSAPGRWRGRTEAI